MQRWDGVKAFAATTAGKLSLVALTTVGLIGSFVYLGAYLVIIVFLLLGMLLPIYLGWKRPRQLALAGLVALLIAAPLAAPLEASMLLAPSPSVSSDSQAPYGNGAPVIQAAVVHPFNAPGGSTFNFTARLFPQNIPKGDGPLLFLSLWVSTCPGATSNSSPSCQSGYPFYFQNRTFSNASAVPGNVSFLQALSGDNIWWWLMAGGVRNVTTGNLTWIFVDPGNGYGAVQGPITGSYLTTVEYVLPVVFLSMFLYAGSVFFVALLVYALFKSREAKRRQERDGFFDTAGATPPPSPGTPAPPPVEERTCPNCRAVVYPNETACWKCGTKLTAAPAPNPAQKPLP